MFWRTQRPSRDAAAIRILNAPRLLSVTAYGNLPRVVQTPSGPQSVEAILDIWRIDDEWWRERISRRYFRVVLEGGAVRTIFHDLVRDEWFEQRY